MGSRPTSSAARSSASTSCTPARFVVTWPVRPTSRPRSSAHGVGARRRGKYLWLPLDNGDAVLAHLGMSGQMLVQPVGAPDERHLRVRFALEGAAPRAPFR